MPRHRQVDAKTRCMQELWEMRSNALLYCRKNNDWLEAVIVDGSDLLIKMRLQGTALQDQAKTIMVLADRYQAVVGVDITPCYGGSELLNVLHRNNFHDLWVFPTAQFSGDRGGPKQYGMWMSAAVSESIYQGIKQEDLSWDEQCEYTARWMLHNEPDYCEKCGK